MTIRIVEQLLAAVPETGENLYDLITGLAWPTLVLLALVVFSPQLWKIANALAKRIENGAPIKFPGGIYIGAIDQGKVNKALSHQLQSAGVSDSTIALYHTSFRRPDKDREFQNQAMYQIEVVLVGPDDALDLVDAVTYYLDPTYPTPLQEVGADHRASRFKLRELAYGYSIVRADVKIRGTDEVVHLNRFVNLTESGPRI